MQSLSLTKPVFFRNGVRGASAVIGYEGGANRVARYSFVSPSTGASSVSLAVTGFYYLGADAGGGARPTTFRFYIGLDPDSHVNAGANTECSGFLYADTTYKDDFYGSADVVLLPDQVYYLFIFPDTTKYGWLGVEMAKAALEVSGGSYSTPTLSADAVDMGSPVTIYTNRHSDRFTHTITYSFGSASGIIAEDVSDLCEWTPPLELARQIPNAETGVGTIYCATYDGATQIGSTQPVSIYLTVPAQIVPTVTATWADSSSVYDRMGTLVKLVSSLAVDVAGVGAYGSSIVSAALTLDGKPYSGGAILTAGELPFVVTVKDSRGRSGSAAYTLTVADYAIPALTLDASRCTEDGTADDTGEFARVTITGSTVQVNGQNAAALTFSYGSVTEAIDVKVGEFVYEQIVPAPSVAKLTLSAQLSDRLIELDPVILILSVGYATMDLLKGGKGIAFGTTATREGFVCAMPAYFAGGLFTGEGAFLMPPLELDVEYLTAQKFLEKPVYAKVLFLPAGEISAYHGIGELDFPLHVIGTARSGVLAGLYFNQRQAGLSEALEEDAYLLLHYTKA